MNAGRKNALWEAVFADYEDAVAILLDAGTDPHAQGAMNVVSLAYARGNYRIIRMIERSPLF